MSRNPETTYRIMSAIKSKNTTPELLLGKAMWAIGLRYRKHYNIIGKPDFVFLRARMAVFCDGDFWHGNNWKIRDIGSFEKELTTYNPFWANKISKNAERDRSVTKSLEQDGWLVIRFWGNEIVKSPAHCAEIVQSFFKNRTS